MVAISLAWIFPATAEPRPREKMLAELTAISKQPELADDFLRFGFVAPGTMPVKLANPANIRTL